VKMKIKDKAIFSAKARQKIFVDALFKRPKSLAELLPFDEFIEESGLFRMKDGSLGAVF